MRERGGQRVGEVRNVSYICSQDVCFILKCLNIVFANFDKKCLDDRYMHH